MVYDFCVIGSGIVGGATATELIHRNPTAKIVVLEKEPTAGEHQTSHNSGVIHAGIYYAPGSLKAKLCREGLVATKDFCRRHVVPFDECGKLIVATDSVELDRIDDLYERATSNGLRLERLSKKELSSRESNVTGVAALYSPETAIVSYTLLVQRMAVSFVANGGVIRYNFSVDQIDEQENHVRLSGSLGEVIYAKRLIVCGGLQADRLARMAGLDVDFHIVPFRGEYFQLPPSKSDIVKHLIYPAPDPALPFLGVHLTRMINGSVTVGPNAVIGFAREGYPKFSFSLGDTADFVSFPGFWKLIYKFRRHAIHELKGSLFKSAYLRECQKYCPSLTLNDLLPYRAGIRAQVVTSKGELVHDFLFKQTDRMLHVCNAPSPAATSAIPMARMIVDKLDRISNCSLPLK